MCRGVARAGVALASGLMLALVTVAGAPAGRAESEPAWPLVPSPNVGSGENRLLGVTALSRRDAWAVGEFGDSTSNQPPKTLTQHWDGATWTIVPSPNAVGFDTLLAVDGISPTDVWAVGDSVADPSSEAGARTLTEHWDGSAWEIVPSPNTGIEGGNGTLGGVFALASDEVWAVGSYFPDVEAPTLQPLIEHWNGASWQIVPGPSKSPGPWSALQAVS
jgi:hypothetical protein